MNPAVCEAVTELQAAFPGHKVEAIDDGEGGAFVRVYELDYGTNYSPPSGWVTFRITHAYPHADIYPHHLPAGISRVDGSELGAGVHQQELQMGRFCGPSTMLSRRSPRWDPAVDTAALKLAKVLDWFRGH